MFTSFFMCIFSKFSLQNNLPSVFLSLFSAVTKCYGKLHILSATAFKPCLLAEGQGAGIGKEDNTIDQQFGQSNKEPLLDATIEASIQSAPLSSMHQTF